jgi:lipopolysaccharide/colanic/teichoic acid biosynthesis glycosyltransferase
MASRAEASRWRDRITPLGWSIRTTRLYELPQLRNVVKAEMSFVGPHPERPQFVCEANPETPSARSAIA